MLKRFGFHISAITLEQASIDYAIKETIIDEGSTALDKTISNDIEGMRRMMRHSTERRALFDKK